MHLEMGVTRTLKLADEIQADDQKEKEERGKLVAIR